MHKILDDKVTSVGVWCILEDSDGNAPPAEGSPADVDVVKPPSCFWFSKKNSVFWEIFCSLHNDFK